MDAPGLYVRSVYPALQFDWPTRDVTAATLDGGRSPGGRAICWAIWRRSDAHSTGLANRRSATMGRTAATGSRRDVSFGRSRRHPRSSNRLLAMGYRFAISDTQVYQLVSRFRS